MHQTSPPLQPLQKDNNLSPRTKLASLVKGRWIDGKTQTVALLRFTCDIPTLFMLQTLLPSRRRDCHSTTPSQNLTIPRLTLNLPPLSKVRCCRPKKFGRLFCRQDGGIASPPPFAPHQPFQNRTITLAFRSAIVCVCLYGFAFKLSHLAFRRARVCVCLVGFASIAIVVVCGRCVTASSAISVAASCSD
ncbi:uncharacterized protein BN788_02178 [[Eubacterium] siraeum CAG:80]|uniref:Uncharacterized protein n=1 Tax=[Eubacterium] siraeum CAG:80 TaxID=1263080 RepID=R6RE98_9FIRM|nr:uncharacterized protein BN788_02178 [[Eubacterium] siraeum CAG:80]